MKMKYPDTVNAKPNLGFGAFKTPTVVFGVSYVFLLYSQFLPFCPDEHLISKQSIPSPKQSFVDLNQRHIYINQTMAADEGIAKSQRTCQERCEKKGREGTVYDHGSDTDERIVPRASSSDVVTNEETLDNVRVMNESRETDGARIPNPSTKPVTLSIDNADDGSDVDVGQDEGLVNVRDDTFGPTTPRERFQVRLTS
ncbi:hypothetical protein CROQUDRAFT_110771 [Cronartium quercuum f. sp. fusiforme G11]|uniref:Uncharacterized protein n=1 Tax=Cronartium quercuum f. sp. fusiforme G11 TaxID=708437 RepID=A0A9P6T804_9BASI|nr:hypothetical protein CROQUDRAFT_110771 [Cronartium quercuum f. sp. fusiforme G11]